MDKNLKTEIEKNKDLLKEKNKSKEIPKDITELKKYIVPDANNKKNFDKINIYNFIGITKFLYYPEMIEISFVNKKMCNIINHKYPKRIPLMKELLKSLKKHIFINFSEDFRFFLRKNSSFVSEIMRNMIESISPDYFPKMRTKKYFFSKMKSNPDIKSLLLDNCDIGKKSIKYLSYYFNNKNCNITDINISGNKITGEILKPLGKNPNVKLNYLIANKCIVDVKTFVNLSKLNTKKLSLINNNIDIEYISKLENNNINELNLSHNFISNESVFCICKNLPNLRKLNLGNNNICDLSILYICLYIKSQKNKLISLNLKDNKITITGMITLLSTIEKINKENNNNYSLNKLNLSGNLLDLVPIPKRLGTEFLFVRIEKLFLGNHSYNINDLNILLSFINNIQNITVLDLSKTVFDNVTIKLIFNRVSENMHLKKLKLKYCYLGNTEVNNTLENYYIKNCCHLNDKKNNKTKNKNNNKKEFRKKNNNSNNNSIINEKDEDMINEENEEIQNNNNNNIVKKENTKNEIEKNNTNNTPKTKDKEEKEKEKNNNNNKIINENDNNIIINNKEEKNMYKKDNNNIIINEYEEVCVESLNLGYNFINYHKLDKIILSNHIKELNIEGNDLHLWGNDIYLFFDSIINNKVLEKLNLNKNNLQNMANKLLEKINNFNIDNNSNCSLKFLLLEDNQIKDINLELTNLLSNNKNLEVLNLRKNLIGDEIGNNYFFHSLFKSKFSNIKEINISYNKISLNFVEKIINYSKENTIEQKNFELNITSNDIRQAYLNKQNKESYKELVNLINIKCL